MFYKSKLQSAKSVFTIALFQACFVGIGGGIITGVLKHKTSVSIIISVAVALIYFAVMTAVGLIILNAGKSKNEAMLGRAVKWDKDNPEKETGIAVLNYQMSADDYVYLNKMLMGRMSNIYMNTAFLVFTALVLAVETAVLGRINVFLAAMFGLCAFFAAMPYISIAGRAKKIFKESKTMGEPAVLTIADGKINEKSALSETTVSQLVEIQADENMAILFLTYGSFFGLHRRHFKDEGQFNYFISKGLEFVRKSQ